MRAFYPQCKGADPCDQSAQLSVGVGQLFERKHCVVTNRAQAVIHGSILTTEPGRASTGLDSTGVRLLTEPTRNWTGAPGSPKRTWAENGMFRMLFAD